MKAYRIKVDHGEGFPETRCFPYNEIAPEYCINDMVNATVEYKAFACVVDRPDIKTYEIYNDNGIACVITFEVLG